MEEVIAEALMNGESVNTGLFRGVAQFRGVAKQNALECSNQQHLCLVHSGQDASRGY
ncbi:hypothetical protein NXW78_01095 [Bacteroides ovatus]|nr:hypothetical protein [Bacteroides ovatus]